MLVDSWLEFKAVLTWPCKEVPPSDTMLHLGVLALSDHGTVTDINCRNLARHESWPSLKPSSPSHAGRTRTPGPRCAGLGS
ncbi:hypothetical protein KIL84_006894 [Mauremys mutica]|uniref:Uncharacterized protein n=1 Tax=Mauremys mutica TaxID=74926 RepID=A0A9D3X0S8_9SAUR|nr:hypothetical protein KIL84_006894 [Mauremys mutica]